MHEDGEYYFMEDEKHLISLVKLNLKFISYFSYQKLFLLGMKLF